LLDALQEPALERSHLLFAARARFLEQLGRGQEAVDALQEALARVGNAPERAWLTAQVERLCGSPSTAEA
jgi:RNA polymerase sigma-70 factor (ECF subfamily)